MPMVYRYPNSKMLFESRVFGDADGQTVQKLTTSYLSGHSALKRLICFILGERRRNLGAR
jgi:hypothetical protein